MRARILGTGMAVPEKRLTNSDLVRMVDTSDEWIIGRTGIKERPIAAPEDATSTFAIPAVQRALEMADVAGEDVDLVICATVTPDTLFPATANMIQHEIGARRACAFDLSAGCSGFVYGVGVASQFLENGASRKAVVVGGEILTKFVDWEDRSTCVLFGDGAGAVVLGSTEEERGVLGSVLLSDGALTDLLIMPGGGSRHPPTQASCENGLNFIKMKGNETFRVAVRSLAEVSDQVLAQADISPSEVRWFIPHQANLRIITAVGQRLAISSDRVYVNVERYGNTSSASIPIALDELNRGGKIEPGDVLLFAAFGAGLTWGATVVRW